MPFLDWLRCRPRRTPPRRPRFLVEALEERALPSGIPITYAIDDPGNQFGAFPLLRKDLQAAGQILSGLLDGKGSLQVLVRPNNDIPRSDGSTVGTSIVRYAGAMTVCESAALAEAQTGVNPNGTGPEIELDFNTQTYLPHVWFDPSGAARTGTVPRGQEDFISVAMHETLHGLAFQGYRAIDGPTYGALPGDTESSFDALTAFGTGPQAGTLYFNGPLTMSVYGGPVPLTTVGPDASLTSQNFYHLGNPSGGKGPNLSGDIMNGMVFAYGTRYTVSRLDLAVLADVGWAAHGFPAPPPPQPAVVPPPPPQPAVVPPPAPLPPATKHASPKHRHVRHRRMHPAKRRATAGRPAPALRRAPAPGTL
jgi:hypothetical protein